MKRVYIAGPYTSDPEQNTRIAIGVADALLTQGIAPYVPHLTHFWHAQHEHPWETWLMLDLAWVAVSDAVYRLRGDSPGADREVNYARTLGIPVFTSLTDLVRWASGREVRP